MGASAKKKREKKQDFQKVKLKVGKTRPKNTNATDTSFSAKSIVFKQQSLSEDSRDASTAFKHNLSLLSSKNDVQRKDALAHLTSAIAAAGPDTPLQPASVVLAKAQPLILDSSAAVRSATLKLLRALALAPRDHLGPIDQALLYTRAGMTHLSADIRLSALDVLEWLLDVAGAQAVGGAGGWVKTLRTFQTLLAWHFPAGGDSVVAAAAATRSASEGLRTIPAAMMTTTTTTTTTTGIGIAGAHRADGKWTAAKPGIAATAAAGGKLGSGSKLLVRQLILLARVLDVGLTSPAEAQSGREAHKAAAAFPLWARDAYALPRRSNAFGYLNLFGAPRDVESEVYDQPEQRADVFVELGMNFAFAQGVREAKREGGEVGRAAAMVEKALKLV